jgi:pSer/pThr/pTyr-binding forkhead associated (FHA) protein
MSVVPLNGAEPIPLLKNRFVIGRAADCDLQIQDASVSGRHCELRFDDYQWTLIDLNSRNGVRLNGDIIKKHSVRAGDTIVIGTLRLRLKDAREETPQEPKTGSRKIWVVFGTMLLIAASAAATAVVLFKDRLGF